jgi:class 3 adenylate cyclase
MNPARPRRVSVATRLAVAVIAVSAVAVSITSLGGLLAGERAAGRLIEQRLVSIHGAERSELQAYLGALRGSVIGLASSPMTTAALAGFSEAVDRVQLPEAAELEAQRRSVADHLAQAVLPSLGPRAAGGANPSNLVPETDAGVHLQYLFLPEVTGTDAVEVVEVAGAEGWSAVHEQMHPVYRTAARRLDVEDLYLIRLDGTVVYSVTKSADFATSLRVGPHSASALGAGMRRTIVSEPGQVTMVDTSAYVPALGRPVWFQMAPVFEQDRVIGALAVRVTVDPLNKILGTGGRGPEGFGETGELYLVGSDGLLRSDPRGFRESAATYLADAEAAGTLTGTDATIVQLQDSTVLVQRAGGDLAASALGPGEVLRRTDHLGRDALMVTDSVVMEGLDWVLVAQISAEEASTPVRDYRRLLLLVATLVAALVTFGAVAWANRIMRPVRLVGDRLRGRAPDATSGAVRALGCHEFERLAQVFDSMSADLATRRAAVDRAHEERRSVLRSLLPASIARRIDAGDRSAVERPSAASVVVIVLHGSESVDPTGVRWGLGPLIARLDRVGERHGLGRVKLVGDSCFCAVGHQQSYLDHARRAVAFARDLCDESADDAITVSIGIASGPINVGLGGSSHLVYDIWGHTVTEAYLLARQASPAMVLLAAGTVERLPAEVQVDPVAADASMGVGAESAAPGEQGPALHWRLRTGAGVTP